MTLHALKGAEKYTKTVSKSHFTHLIYFYFTIDAINVSLHDTVDEF